MSAGDALVTLLAGRPSVDGAEVVDWRMELAEGDSVRVGVRGSRLGGPYEGPGSSTRLGGTMMLHWSDGRVSSVTLGRRALLDPAAHLAEWRASGFSGRRGRLPPIAGPAALPAVETFDRAVARAVDDDPSELLESLRRIVQGTCAGGVRRLDGVLRAGRGQRTVLTSRGFRAAWAETTCTLDLWADEVSPAAYGRRALFSSDDLDRLAGELTTLAQRLRRPGALPVGVRGVIFAPRVVDELLGRLLLPNLAGRAIGDARSPFTRADLDSGRAIVRDDLDLVVDTTIAFALATAPCSPEGVPAGRVALIAGGRLASPSLDLETADDFHLPPTPWPRGRPGAFLLSGHPSLSFDEAAAMLGDGVVVRDLPGLHTQQPRRSRYALVAPDAEVIRGGRPGGRCAVRLAGNLLDHLSQPSTQLVRMSGELGVGLLVLTGVELLPA